jgi:hypothetical protein
VRHLNLHQKEQERVVLAARQTKEGEEGAEIPCSEEEEPFQEEAVEVRGVEIQKMEEKGVEGEGEGVHQMRAVGEKKSNPMVPTSEVEAVLP